jgi:hypothetical protein
MQKAFHTTFLKPGKMLQNPLHEMSLAIITHTKLEAYFSLRQITGWLLKRSPPLPNSPYMLAMQ